MALAKRLFEALVCPKCKRAIQLVDEDRSLMCASCQLKFPIRDNVPIMTMDEALDLGNVSSEGVGVLATPSLFRVIEGPDKGLTFSVEAGICRGMGRSSSDPEKTSVFSVDFALSIDDNTKRLITNYISQQFRKMKKGEDRDPKEKEFGSFRRASDVVLTDLNVSRLHVMIFYDGETVGVLDLVSRNGTFVNGKEVESKILEIGDVIEIGETKLMREGN
ncbi:MAG: FHA domain-containing protein [Pseudomonadota bacterium]